MWFEDELLLDAERVPRMPDLLIRVDDGAALRAQNDWEYGPRELWLVNLESWSVKVHRSDGTWERREDDDLISPQLPGFRVQVDALFPYVDPTPRRGQENTPTSGREGRHVPLRLALATPDLRRLQAEWAAAVCIHIISTPRSCVKRHKKVRRGWLREPSLRPTPYHSHFQSADF